MAEDRNQEDIQTMEDAQNVDPQISAAQAAQVEINNDGQYADVTGNTNKEELINISSCDFPEFKQFMGDKFGEDVFL